MPSSPKVQKETILKAAFDLLIREGYGGVNIKTVARELGCSTQPISRQFGSMEGFRKDLLVYSIGQMKSFDFPNLYKFLYMSEHAEERVSEFISCLRAEKCDKVMEMLRKEYDMPEAYAQEYLKNLNFYVHGVAAFAAVGFIQLSKQEVLDQVQRVSVALLKNWREMHVS